MNKAYKFFKSQLMRNYKMHDNLLPGEPLKLGDYGILKRGKFERFGNLTKDFPINFSKIKSKAKDFQVSYGVNLEMGSRNSLETTDLILPKMNLTMEFSTEKSTYFRAKDANVMLIDSLNNLKQKILVLYESGKWNTDYVIVNKIVESSNTTFFLSNGSAATVAFEVDATEKKFLNNLNVNANMELKSMKNIGHSVCSKEKMYPLIHLIAFEFKPIFCTEESRLIPIYRTNYITPIISRLWREKLRSNRGGIRNHAVRKNKPPVVRGDRYINMRLGNDRCVIKVNAANQMKLIKVNAVKLESTVGIRKSNIKLIRSENTSQMYLSRYIEK